MRVPCAEGKRGLPGMAILPHHPREGRGPLWYPPDGHLCMEERRTTTMTHNPYECMRTNVHSADTMAPGGHTVAPEGRSAPMACGMGHRSLKSLVLMTACCAAPLLLLLALPVLGTGLGGRIALSVQTLAVFACPVGMALMMWMMRGRRADAQPPTQAQPVQVACLPQDSRASTGHSRSPLAVARGHALYTRDTLSVETISARQERTTRSIR